MRLAVRENTPDADYENGLMFLYDSIFPLLRTESGIHLQQFFRMDEEYIFRQHRLDLRELDIKLVLCHLYALIYPADRLFKKLQRPLSRGYDLLPVPLVDINGMHVIQFLLRTKGIHVGVYASTFRNLHLRKLHPLPLRKRMDYFGLRPIHVLHRKCDRTFHTVQIVIKAHSAHHDHRSRHSEQSKLSGKIVLEHILYGLDGLFCIFDAAEDVTVAFRYHQ